MLFVLSARWSENLLRWFTMPRNVLTSCTFVGAGRSAIAFTLSGSTSIPFELMTCPRNLTCLVLKTHLSRWSLTPASNRRSRTASSLSSCWCWSLPWTSTSSMLHSTPSKPNRIWFMVFWNFSEPELIPKGNTLKQNRPQGVMNVVKGLDSQANLICQKPEFASSLVKTVEPDNLPNVVSTAGRG